MLRRLVTVFCCLGILACSKGGPPTTPKTASADRAVSLEALDYPIGSTDVERGAVVYAEFCEGCHPGGQEGDGPKIAGMSESPSEFRYQVRNGDKDMPSFDASKIPPGDLEALLAYAVTLDVVSPSF